MPVEPVTEPAQLGESPLWDDRHARLMWVDILGHAVHAYDPATGTDRMITVDRPPAAILPVADRDDYLLALGSELCFLDWAAGGISEPFARLAAGERANDGAVDSHGRLLIGTMIGAGDRPGEAALYRVQSGTPELILDQVTISNGLDWSPDGSTLYYVDTPLDRIDAFDYDQDTAAISGRRTVVDTADLPGRPDGLTVDTDGCIWVAMARGGAGVRRFRPDGTPDRVIPIGVPNVTSLAFAGPDHRDLFVTTSRLGLDEQTLARFPAAGSVFHTRLTDVTGRPPNEYRPAG